MRFYTEIRADKYKHLREISKYPYLTFATDLIYFITRMYGMNWYPYRMAKPLRVCEILHPDHRSYYPHPLSPCSKSIQMAVRSIILNSKRNYKKFYKELVPTDAENKLELFINHANEVFGEFYGKITSPLEMLFKLVYVGRMTVMFYKKGTKDALHLAPSLIACAMREMTWEWSPAELFEEMNVFANEVVKWYQIAKDGEEFDEEIFEDSEIYEILFDESDEGSEELYPEEHEVRDEE